MTATANAATTAIKVKCAKNSPIRIRRFRRFSPWIGAKMDENSPMASHKSGRRGRKKSVISPPPTPHRSLNQGLKTLVMAAANTFSVLYTLHNLVALAMTTTTTPTTTQNIRKQVIVF
jgi:hypothetical protein